MKIVYKSSLKSNRKRSAIYLEIIVQWYSYDDHTILSFINMWTYNMALEEKIHAMYVVSLWSLRVVMH